MQLRHGVAAHLSWRAIVLRDALGALLQTAADDRRAVVDFANDQDRADDTRGQALQHDRLIVVDRNLATVVRERDRVRWGRRKVGLRRRRRGRVHAAGRLVYVDDEKHEGI